MKKNSSPLQDSTANSRDVSLDLLKGIGCLLMILAHAKVLVPESTFAIYIGEFAPVFFFSVSGITGVFQAHKYAPLKMLIVYVLLAFLGFAYNGIATARFLEYMDFDILQMIAFGTLASYFVERYFKPNKWWYAILAIFSFLAKVILIRSVVFTGIPWIYGILIPLGLFSIFPWLFLFFAGIFSYKAENKIDLLALISLLALYLILDYFKYPLDPQNKWDMSVGYFLLCNIILFAVFYGVGRFAYFRNEKNNEFIRYLGRNSLLFLFVHAGLVEILHDFKHAQYLRMLIDYPLLIWLLLIFLTTVIMWLLLTVLKQDMAFALFSSAYIWIALIICIFISAWFVESRFVLVAIYLFIGVLTALYFPIFTARLKNS